MEAYKGIDPEGREFIYSKGRQFMTEDGKEWITVQWRGHLMVWDLDEGRPRPLALIRDQPVKEVHEVQLSEKYIFKMISDRERKMGRRIYG